MTPWTGRRIWRRRQRSSLTLQYITSVENFFNQNLILLVYLGWHETSLYFCIKKIDVNHHHHCISHPSWRKFPTYCQRPAWSSACLNVVRHVESTCKEFSYQPTSTNHITSWLRTISTDVIYCNVSDLPGLLLQVLLAVHGVVDHQLSCT